MKVAICYATYSRPTDAFLESLEREVPLLDAAGIEHKAVCEVGCPYISGARATLIRRSMGFDPDAYVFIDDDVSWSPGDLVKLIQAKGDVIGGTYRFKTSGEPKYMGKSFLGPNGKPLVRADGAISAICLPAGFLKVTKRAVRRFMKAYPELTINADGLGNTPDLFNHGAHKGIWFGEDYAFCRRWLECGGEVWLLPDLWLDHNGRGDDLRVWRGNFHRHLLALGRKD